MNAEKKIKVDYYKGPFGPTIRVSVPSTEALTILRKLFNNLASGSISNYSFRFDPLVELIGLQDLCLHVVRERKCKTVDVIRRENEQAEAIWSNNLDGWDQCLGLLDGLTGTIPGHQYLS